MSVTGSVFGYPKFKSFMPNSNVPNAGGLLNTYVGGSVNTPQVAYQDEACTVPWSNPITLDSNGEALIFFYPVELYKLVLTDSNNNVLWTIDNQTGIAPPYSPSTSTFQKARGYRNSALTFSASQAWQKIPIDSVSYDASGIISVANGRISPTLAGTYSVKGAMAQTLQTGSSNTCGLGVAFYKNGSLYSVGDSMVSINIYSPVGNYAVATHSDDIPLNGSGDYVELWGFYVNSASLALTVGSAAFNFLTIMGPF